MRYNKLKWKKANRQKQLPKQIKHHAQEGNATLFKKIVKVISGTSKLIHFYIATSAVGIGFIFNAFDEMPVFWIKGLFGFILYIILSHTIMYIEKKNCELKKELTGDPQLAKCQEDYAKRIYSNSNFVLCIISCIYFVTISIVLGFVVMNPIGIYSLFALACVVFLAFIIFQQYLYILFLL